MGGAEKADTLLRSTNCLSTSCKITIASFVNVSLMSSNTDDVLLLCRRVGSSCSNLIQMCCCSTADVAAGEQLRKSTLLWLRRWMKKSSPVFVDRGCEREGSNHQVKVSLVLVWGDKIKFTSFALRSAI